MRILRIEFKQHEVNGGIVNKYDIIRSYTDREIKSRKLSIEAQNKGVIVESFNSYENAKWFVSSIKLIKHVNDVLDACAECETNNYQPNLMVRTPRRLNEYIKDAPETLIKKLSTK